MIWTALVENAYLVSWSSKSNTTTFFFFYLHKLIYLVKFETRKFNQYDFKAWWGLVEIVHMDHTLSPLNFKG